MNDSVCQCWMSTEAYFLLSGKRYRSVRWRTIRLQSLYGIHSFCWPEWTFPETLSLNVAFFHRTMKSIVTPLWSLKIPAPECLGWSQAPSTSFRSEPGRQQAVDDSARTWRSRPGKQVCVRVCECGCVCVRVCVCVWLKTKKHKEVTLYH